MRRRVVGPLGVATALLAGFGLFASTAVADPGTPSDEDIASVDAAADDTAAAIAGLEAELATNRAALEAAEIAAAVAHEDYADAAAALELAETEQTEADAAAAAAEAELDDASAALAELAMASYRSGGDLAQIGAMLSADGIEDALAEATTYQVLGTSTSEAEQRYAAAESAALVASERAADAVSEREAAAAVLEDAKADADAAAASAARIVASNEQRRSELVVELAVLRETSVAMEQQRQEEAEAARLEQENDAAAVALGVAPPQERPAQTEDPDPTSATPTTQTPRPTTTTTRPTQAPTTTTPRPTTTTPRPTTPPSTPAPPASDNANAAALAWARTQLGKPYVYGAAGPSSYDCSGLTMRAYEHAGISIARNSRAQYYSGAYVPVGQMKPGDLIFYSNNGAASGIYHVAIYAGNGMRLHAPRPGSNVELVPMYWTNVLPNAVRP